MSLTALRKAAFAATEVPGHATTAAPQWKAGGQPCALTGRFTGVAYIKGRLLELASGQAWVAITRSNDKRSDDLRVRVESLQRPPVAIGTFELSPTVDTAGPSLTTWQIDDTLRLVSHVPKPFQLRRLAFIIRYSFQSFVGVRSYCADTLTTGVLHFTRGPPNEALPTVE